MNDPFLTAPPTPTRHGPPGDTVIVTFNLYNLLATPDRLGDFVAPGGADRWLNVKLRKLALALRGPLALPTIVVVQEVESTELLQAVADRVNRAVGTGYRALAPPCSDRRGIRVGFLWDAQRTTLAAWHQLDGADAQAAFGPSSPSPGREPLVGEFDVFGRRLLIVANHFKSDHVPAEVGDVAGARAAHQAQRVAQARVVRAFAEAALADDPAVWLMVAGDLNDSAESTLPDGSHGPVALVTGSDSPAPLVNLLPAWRGRDAYTFLRADGPVAIDHILVSPALAERTVGVDVLHFNTGSADSADDPYIPHGVSDHDPVEARFYLAPA